jgi:hypothetical protein
MAALNIRINMEAAITKHQIGDIQYDLYVSFASTAAITDAAALLTYLRQDAPQPLLLRRRRKSEGTTIELEALGTRTQVRFYLSPNAGGEDVQVQSIMAALNSVGLTDTQLTHEGQA